MDGAVCIANIDRKGRRQRLALGIAGQVAATAVGFGGWALGFAPTTRLPAAILYFGGFVGVFQARKKT